MTPDEELRRAAECQQVLGNRYVQEALKDIRESLVEQWLMTPVKDVEMREKIWSIACGAKKFEQLLRTHIETGSMVMVEEQRKKTLAERLKNWAA